jgi:hypothetical protein
MSDDVYVDCPLPCLLASYDYDSEDDYHDDLFEEMMAHMFGSRFGGGGFYYDDGSPYFGGFRGGGFHFHPDYAYNNPFTGCFFAKKRPTQFPTSTYGMGF